MDLLNRIKLIFSKEQEKEDETIKEIIQIEELPSKLEGQINELDVLKEQLKDTISKRIFDFEVETNEKIRSLEHIDISQRKENEQIKIIVKENLNLYISHLKRTIDNMRHAEKEEMGEYINRLFRVLNEFNRISSMPFEKATILIGDELGSTRAIVRSFIQEINKIVEDNNFIFEKSRLCHVMSNLLSESEQITLLQTDIENKLLEMKAVLENAVEEKGMLKIKLSEIKERDDFKRDNQEKIDYRKRLDSLEEDIQSIKRELDLKSLLKKFHHDKIIDRLVRNYVNDFKNTLEDDKELKIIDIIDSNDKKPIHKLREIQKTLVSLRPFSPTKIDIEIDLLEKKTKEESAHILDLENEIKNEIKRKEKLSLKLQKINSDLMEKSLAIF